MLRLVLAGLALTSSATAFAQTATPAETFLERMAVLCANNAGEAVSVQVAGGFSFGGKLTACGRDYIVVTDQSGRTEANRFIPIAAIVSFVPARL